MRKTGKIIDFTPYDVIMGKDGNLLTGKTDGLPLMKRTVVVDCSFISEQGSDIREGYVCDMYTDMLDEKLATLRDTGQKVVLYINMDYTKSEDGRYFQKVTLKRISEM